MRECRQLVLVLSLILLGGCANFYPGNDALVYQEVFYLTTRTGNGSEIPRDRYTTDRGDPVYGMAMVAIDSRKQLSGFSKPQPNRYLRQTQLLRSGPLQQVEEVPQRTFLERVHGYPDGEPVQDVLVFIHGYRRTFTDCAVNAAHLRYQLAFPGPVVTFAWPSTESVSGYMADLQNLEWSIPQLTRLLEDLADTLPEARIHILAHSMGSRALVDVLTAIQAGQSRLGTESLGEIILMAPDLDRDYFLSQVAGQIRSTGLHISLYVSAEDFPLMTSSSLFQYPRLGDARDGVPVYPGIETIDVSEAITMLDGHGYYESDRDTIEDLYHLIREGLPASQRPNLVEVDGPDGPYFRLLPAGN